MMWRTYVATLCLWLILPLIEVGRTFARSGSETFSMLLTLIEYRAEHKTFALVWLLASDKLLVVGLNRELWTEEHVVNSTSSVKMVRNAGEHEGEHASEWTDVFSPRGVPLELVCTACRTSLPCCCIARQFGTYEAGGSVVWIHFLEIAFEVQRRRCKAAESVPVAADGA